MKEAITIDGIEQVREALDKEESTQYHGAMDVEYEQFAKQYVYISNLEKRFDHPFKLILVSLDEKEGETPQPDELEKCMDCMEEAIRQTIRNVDVMTRYGTRQFLIILLGTDSAGAKIAVERIFKDYDGIRIGSAYTPSYFIEETGKTEE